MISVVILGVFSATVGVGRGGRLEESVALRDQGPTKLPESLDSLRRPLGALRNFIPPQPPCDTA